MKSVRIFFSKKGRMRFISHLDMTRFMARMIKKAGLDIWYTEGFHSRAYITFALPLSLGFESEYEIMDIRLEDDNISYESVCDRLNAVFPEYIHAFKACEPQQKAGKIGAAVFSIRFSDKGVLLPALEGFLSLDSIPCSKKTKRGAVKEIDLKGHIKNAALNTTSGDTVLTLTLPAGSQENINPELLCNAFFENAQEFYPYIITKTSVLDLEGKLFL